MGFLGTVCGVLTISLIGVHLAEGGGSADICATPEKIAEINLMVDVFQAEIDIIMNSGGPEMERHERVFYLACQNTTYKAQVDKIAIELSNCLELVSVTKLPTLSFGPITFVQLLTNFPAGGVVEFCDCSPYLASAMALEQMKNSYSVVVANAEYGMVANLPFYCEENLSVGPSAFNIRAMLSKSLMGLDGACNRVYNLAGMGSKAMAMHIREFLPMCPTFDAVKFQCALDKSTTAEFKTCMGSAMGAQAACGKYACIKDQVMPDNQCGPMGAQSYITAVNIQKGMDELVVKTDSECGGGSADICATPEKIAEINFMVDVFQAEIDIIMNSGGSEMERHERVFYLACQNTTNKAQVDKLALDLSNCLELVSVTKLPTLSFGQITFVQLLTNFPGGIIEFCDCSPYLASAMALEQMKSSYSVVVANAEYGMVANLPFYCEENLRVGPNAVNVRAMLSNSLMGLDGACNNVYNHAGMGSKAMAMHIREFLPMCPTFDAVKFQCALDKSATAEFKTCMGSAMGAQSACSKYACITDHVMPDNQCGPMGAQSYIKAVNIQKGMEELVAKADSECGNNAAGVGQLSVMALVASLLIAFFF